MISLIFTDSIALDFGAFIAERARNYRVSKSAILSAIQSFVPSQPVPHTLADVPAWPMAGLTDGEAATQPSSPSVEPIPDAPKPPPAEIDGDHSEPEQPLVSSAEAAA